MCLYYTGTTKDDGIILTSIHTYLLILTIWILGAYNQDVSVLAGTTKDDVIILTSIHPCLITYINNMNFRSLQPGCICTNRNY